MNDTSAEELFCLRYELRLLAGLVLEGKLERWIEGFTRPETHREHVQRYAFAAGLGQGRRVLDLACGTGRGTRMLAEGGAAAVVGGDLEADAIRYAAHRNPHPALTFQVADGMNFRDPDGFELIVCFETIEHVPDARLFLRNLRRNLRPGGKLLVSTPVSAQPINHHPSNPYHVVEWGWQTFQDLVAEVFQVEQVHAQYTLIPQRPPWPARILHKVRKVIGANEKPTGFDGETHLIEWDKAGINPAGAATEWWGYQLLECRHREAEGGAA